MPGVIGDSEEIISFLDAVAAEAPPAVRKLAGMVKKAMQDRKRSGEPFLGFVLQNSPGRKSIPQPRPSSRMRVRYE